MYIQRILQNIGYHPNEIKVYFAILKLGSATIAEITKKAQLPRSTTRLVLSHLETKLLVTKSIHKSNYVWMAENPSKILSDLHEKEIILEKVLPKLQSLHRESTIKPLLTYYSGRAKIQSLLDSIAQSQYEVKIIASPDYMAKCLDKTMVDDFFYQLFSRSAATLLLSHNCPLVTELNEKRISGNQKIHIHHNQHLYNIAYILCDTVVSIILLNARESVGVQFENTGLTDFSVSVFNYLWEEAI